MAASIGLWRVESWGEKSVLKSYLSRKVTQACERPLYAFLVLGKYAAGFFLVLQYMGLEQVLNEHGCRYAVKAFAESKGGGLLP